MLICFTKTPDLKKKKKKKNNFFLGGGGRRGLRRGGLSK